MGPFSVVLLTEPPKQANFDEPPSGEEGPELCEQRYVQTMESRGVDQTAAVKPSNGSRRQTRLEVPTKNSAYDNVLSPCLVTHQGSTCILTSPRNIEYSFTAETDLAHSFLFDVAEPSTILARYV